MSLTDFATPPLKENAAGGGEIIDYVMDRVNRWRKFRDGNYEQKWYAYSCLYRGEWNNQLKTKTAERSKIITPATTNAVDQSVSEIIEAIFGRGVWFDVDEDDKPPQVVAQAKALQQQLLDDLHNDGIKQQIIGVVQNGAVYGTGIAKRIIDEEDYEQMSQGPAGPTVTPGSRAYVCWEPVLPMNFVIDSSATCIKDAHGCAHETLRPKHEVARKQKAGVYLPGDVGSASGYGSADILMGPNGETYEKEPEDGVYITEYHGLVPKWMLTKATEDKKTEEDPLESIREDGEEGETDTTRDDYDVVEAIVTIANGGTLLKAVENPILNKDRGFIAYQHYTAPNRFWGIGVPEKAFNSQSALDAEIRARMDTLALVTYPSITADATRLPKQLDLTVVPGKVFRTNGRGSEIIEPLKFGSLDPVTFQHSADLERYVQMATGSGDPSTPVNTNRGSAGATASGSSMQFGSYIKRAKLPMQTIDEQFLDPLIRKSLLAYMTIDPDRYPSLFDYSVNSTLSIMAREFEQMQLTNLLAVVPQGSPEFQTVLTAIITNYSGPSKDKLLADIAKAQAPNPAAQQAQQLQQQTAQKTLEKLQAEINEINARAQYTGSKVNTDQIKLKQHDRQLTIEEHQTLVSQQKVHQADKALDVQQTGHLVNAVLKTHHINKQTEASKARQQAAST